MTMLDTLARNSAAAVHTSVGGVMAPVGGIARAAHVAALWRTASFAMAGAAAGVAVVLALLVAGPTLEPADTVVPTTSVVVPTPPPEPVATPTTLAPSPSKEPAPIAVVPGGDSDPTPVEAPDVDPPALSVTSPHNGDHLETSVVVFSGFTEPGASVIASGKFPATVEGDGSWSVSLVLAPGANGVRFVATDSAGNESEAHLTVHFDVDEPKATTTTEAGWVFSANQKYGSCSESVPYDVFNGKAQPGTTVTISSPHGGGSTTANGEGKWNLQVNFPSAPFNEQFTVTVRDHTDSTKTFSFVSLYEG